MTVLKGANLTKYDAGGSGDNYIADGFIKSVEKVWQDSYAVTAAIGSDDSIAIGRVPKGKKITDIVLYTPELLGATSNCTIFIGTGSAILMTAANCFLGTLQADGVAAGTDTFNCNKGQTLRLKGDKFQTEAPTDLVIYAKIMCSGGVDTATTGGTIKSIIKYT